ncbi:MAG: HD domain-containing protein [Bacteroidota bacterium]|nr:HD domain-containing protein [Bacteroidota bacterium]
MNIRKLKTFITKKLRLELSKDLTYHGLHHTLDVLNVCNDYIKRLKLNPHEAYLLRTAALLHDVGILWKYVGHEAAGVSYSHNLLPDYGYSQEDIKKIEGMIMATKIPQKPHTILERIICDADLDYLGRADFYPIGNTLYKEFMAYKVVQNEFEWDELQIKFLTDHYYHTNFAKKYREPKKVYYLKELKIKLNKDIS